MQILDLRTEDEAAIQRVADLLIAGFKDSSGSWFDKESASQEVRKSLESERISRIAVTAEGEIVGWIGGLLTYEDGRVWELHPLVVHPDEQGKGIGRALVEDFEEQVRARGGKAIQLGTDDEDGRTSLYGVNLYPNVLEHLTTIKNLARHPYEFYQKLGYSIVGVIPDANGFGKPDILMAKTLAL